MNKRELDALCDMITCPDCDLSHNYQANTAVVCFGCGEWIKDAVPYAVMLYCKPHYIQYKDILDRHTNVCKKCELEIMRAIEKTEIEKAKEEYTRILDDFRRRISGL